MPYYIYIAAITTFLWLLEVKTYIFNVIVYNKKLYFSGFQHITFYIRIGIIIPLCFQIN